MSLSSHCYKCPCACQLEPRFVAYLLLAIVHSGQLRDFAMELILLLQQISSCSVPAIPIMHVCTSGCMELKFEPKMQARCATSWDALSSVTDPHGFKSDAQGQQQSTLGMSKQYTKAHGSVTVILNIVQEYRTFTACRFDTLLPGSAHTQTVSDPSACLMPF